MPCKGRKPHFSTPLRHLSMSLRPSSHFPCQNLYQLEISLCWVSTRALVIPRALPHTESSLPFSIPPVSLCGQVSEIENMIDLIGRPLDTKKHTEKRRQNMLYAREHMSRKKLARVAQKVSRHLVGVWLGGVWMAIFWSPKNIFQRPIFPGKSLKFRRIRADFCQKRFRLRNLKIQRPNFPGKKPWNSAE